MYFQDKYMNSTKYYDLEYGSLLKDKRSKYFLNFWESCFSDLTKGKNTKKTALIKIFKTKIYIRCL
jgi:hypothetical protein